MWTAKWQKEGRGRKPGQMWGLGVGGGEGFEGGAERVGGRRGGQVGMGWGEGIGKKREIALWWRGVAVEKAITGWWSEGLGRRGGQGGGGGRAEKEG